ncbi:unnamed protein product [Orchesella dallaii]|uniref:Teneurin-3 n=1 Tax=Orchesella dallaii TaxID=48710 RepID=A0ABP1QI32_9HEXA
MALTRTLSLVIAVFVLEAAAHVTLTFPPARGLPIDFLNNFWSKPPCGMPKKGSTRTTLVAGSTFNVNWQLGYAHIGGYRIELLDSRERKLVDLTPTARGGGFFPSNSTNQWHRVSLPKGLQCKDCTIRLLREVKSFDPNFNFWSCGDVDIIEIPNYVERCSGNGKYLDGKCVCDDAFWGRICQFKDECGTDEQCGGRGGKCLYMGGTNLPRRQCFCRPGFHGENCLALNPIELPDPSHSLNLTGHTLQILSDRMILYYKMIPHEITKNQEIEFVLLVNGTSWAALGFRPSNLGAICKSWPFIADALDPTNSNAIGTRKTRQFGPGSPEQNVGSEYAAKDVFSMMDCTDIIVGSAKGSFHRIRDHYARGRHTPIPDNKWGGTDDVTASTGWEKDGVTTLIFRRKLRTHDVADHPIHGEMLVTWARGQEPGEYVRDPNLRLERDEPRVSGFYVRDELKYHGLGDQKGFLYIDFQSKISRVPGINADILQ